MNNLSLLETYYNDILINFNKFSIVFLFISIVIAVWKWKDLNQILKLFFYYSLILLFLHILEHIHIWGVMKYDPYWELMKRLNIRDTSFFGIFLRLTVLYFLGEFYSKILDEPNSRRIKVMSILLLVSAVLIYWFIDGYNQYGTINSVITRVFSIMVSALYLKQVFVKSPNLNLWKNPYFLISQSIIISNVLSMLFAFIAERIHYTDFIMYAQLTIVRNIINIGADLLVAYAFYHARYVKHIKK